MPIVPIQHLFRQRRVRVTVDFVLLYDEPRSGLPAELLPKTSSSPILDFIAAGCKEIGVKDAVIQPRASFNVRFESESEAAREAKRLRAGPRRTKKVAKKARAR